MLPHLKRIMYQVFYKKKAGIMEYSVHVRGNGKKCIYSYKHFSRLYPLKQANTLSGRGVVALPAYYLPNVSSNEKMGSN